MTETLALKIERLLAYEEEWGRRFPGAGSPGVYPTVVAMLREARARLGVAREGIGRATAMTWEERRRDKRTLTDGVLFACDSVRANLRDAEAATDLGRPFGRAAEISVEKGKT